MKFAELAALPNVYENFDPKAPRLLGLHLEEIDLKGQWASVHFGNKNPIVLELACGRGEYTLGLAKLYPEKNFIGVDIKGARIWKGATFAHNHQLNNVAFLRTRIEQIDLFFAPEEVSEIWITFPDPFLKDKKENRRLTSPAFLERYRKILNAEGRIHLKTDSDELYAYTKEVLSGYPEIEVLVDREDIYTHQAEFPELEINTYYERMHLAAGKKIKYIRFRFK